MSGFALARLESATGNVVWVNPLHVVSVNQRGDDSIVMLANNTVVDMNVSADAVAKRILSGMTP